MQSIFLEDAQRNLDDVCQKVCQDHEPCIVNRNGDSPVIILSLDDFNAWQETYYLLSNPNNAKRLLRSLDDARSGKLTERHLIEE